MHKKLYSLVITGIIVANAVCSTGNIYANNIDIEKDKRLERTSSEEEDYVDKPQESEWTKFETVESLKGKWNYDDTTQPGKIILKQYLDGHNHPIIEIPRTIGDKRVELEGLNANRFREVTHIRIAKGNDDNKVKLISDSLRGFGAFYEENTIQYLDLSGLDTTGLTSLEQTFRECTSLEYANLSGWDVSQVSKFTILFYNCPKLKYVDLSGWNIKSDADTYMVLAGCTSLKEVKAQHINKTTLDKLGRRYPQGCTLDVSNADLRDTTSLAGLFANSQVSNVKGLETWDTSNITDMSGIFRNCPNLTSIEALRNWKTNSLTNMSDMFEGCRSLTDMSPIEHWNTSNVTLMNGIFFGCSSIETLDLSTWNTSNVTNFHGMFKDCSSLTAINGIEGWSTSRVTSMKEIFRGCSKLQSLNLTRWDMSNVTNIESMFLQCRALTNLDVSRWDTRSVTNMNWLFEDCNSLTEIQGINTWNTSNTADMQGVFQRCNKLNNLDLSHWNTDRVNYISYMFKGCTSLSSLNISNWNVSNVSSMIETFMNTPSLNLIDLSNWSLRNDVNTSNMFKIEGNTPAKILIITNNQTLKDYNYRGVNRIPAKVTVDANDGQFVNANQKTKERFTITPNEYNNINNTIKEDINSFGAPIRFGYKFMGWTMSKEPTSKFDMLDMTYNASWQDTNGESSIEIPGLEDGDIIIKTEEGGQAPSYNDEGNIILPQNSTVKIPNVGEVTVQGGNLNPNNGELTLPSGGSIELSSGEIITVPSGSVINTDGSIQIPQNQNITIPHVNGENVTVNPGEGLEAPTIDSQGNLIVQESGAIVTLPENAQVIVPEGTTITPGGNITVANGGEVTLPGDTQVDVPAGSIINTNASITIPTGGGKVTLPNGMDVVLPGNSTINKDGTIATSVGFIIGSNGSIVLTGQNSESNIQIPSINNNGDIVIPNGGATVILQEGEEVGVPQGSLVKPNGTVELPENGVVRLHDNIQATVPGGSIVNTDGSIITPNNKVVITPDGLIEVQGESGSSNMTIPPITNGNKVVVPSINNNGEVTLPNVGKVELISGGSIVIPQNTVVKPSGAIAVPQNQSISIPQENNNNVVITPSNGSEATINEEGNIIIPSGSTVQLPNNLGLSIGVSGATANTQTGEVTLSNGGLVQLPNSAGEIQLPNESVVSPNGEITIPNNSQIQLPNAGVVIKPNESGKVVKIDPNGNITIPENGRVELPNFGTVKAPQGSIVKLDGEITVPEGGGIVILPGDKPVEVPGNSTIKKDGTIVAPNGSIVDINGGITIPGENGNDIKIPSNELSKPSIDNNGVVTMPEAGGVVVLPGDKEVTLPGGTTIAPGGNITIPEGGGKVTLPENIQVTVPGGSIIKPSGDVVVPEGGGEVTLPGNTKVTVPDKSVIKSDGSIVVQNGGKVTLPNNQAISVRPDTVINPDGTIKNPQEQVIPSVMDKIDKEVVNVDENGNGQANSPIVLDVKAVDKDKLNTFLNNLKDLNPKVTAISKDNDKIDYKLEVDNNSIQSKDKTYVTIEVDNNKADLVKAMNKFSKGTNSKVDIPIITSFIDTTKHWAKANIESFASMGIINGYDDKTFKPDAPITRAEFVKVINNAFGYTEAGNVTFTDVKPSDWFYKEIAIAQRMGYINGKTNTTFAPNDKITREEAAKILTTIMHKTDDKLDKLDTFPDGNKTANWAKPYVEGAIEAGYLGGDTKGYLNPTNNITRAEAVTVLSRLK